MLLTITTTHRPATDIGYLLGKNPLALRGFALGLEALHRLTDGEPLYRVHECVFGFLAIGSSRWIRDSNLYGSSERIPL